MAWSPKEKKLTKEAAIAQIRKLLEKFWFGSEPLLTGIRAGQKWVHLPLSPSFSAGTWILLLTDPTEFASEAALQYIREWHRRYSAFDIGFIHIHCPPYQAMRVPEVMEEVLRKNPPPFILALDADQSLTRAFSAESLPKVLVFHKGQCLLENSGEAGIWEIETRLQHFLRAPDPGLPLLSIFQKPAIFRKNCEKIELADPKANIQLSGNWTRLPDRIVTADPQATLRFNHSSSHFSLVARSSTHRVESAKVAIEVNGSLPLESTHGKDLKLREDGLAVTEVWDTKLYEILAKMPLKSKEFKLHFPHATQHPVELFGLRFGD
jgi:hypothetical protein